MFQPRQYPPTRPMRPFDISVSLSDSTHWGLQGNHEANRPRAAASQYFLNSVSIAHCYSFTVAVCLCRQGKNNDGMYVCSSYCANTAALRDAGGPGGVPGEGLRPRLLIASVQPGRRYSWAQNKGQEDVACTGSSSKKLLAHKKRP